MTSATTERSVADARAVSSAARSVVRDLRSGDDVGDAVDRLEIRLQAASEAAAQGFAEVSLTDEDLLAGAATQLGVGLTALSAEAALADPGQDASAALEDAAERLDRLTSALDNLAADVDGPQGFEAGPGATLDGAASETLDTLTAAAATVVSALLGKTAKPLISKLPDTVRTTIEGWHIPGRLAMLGLRAVRSGLNLLATFVDSATIEGMRDRIDRLIARLGQGGDVQQIAGWAIGADAMRAVVAVERPGEARVRAMSELAALGPRFTKLCDLLRRVAGAVAALATVLALFHVANSVVVSTTGFVLIIGVVLTLGRDYTGATNLPGRVRGVGVILQEQYW